MSASYSTAAASQGASEWSNLSLKRKWSPGDDDEKEERSVPTNSLPKHPTAIHPDLCSRCRKVDWAGLIREPPTSRVGRHPFRSAASNISLNQLRQSRCPVCRALALVTPPELDGQQLCIKAFSSNHALGGKYRRLSDAKEYSDCTVIFPVHERWSEVQKLARTGWLEGGCLALVEVGDGEELRLPEVGPRLARPDSIDYSVVRQWMNFCKCKHGIACSISPLQSIKGLRVIDCRTRAVMDAPTCCRYVALSYVWGCPRPNPTDDADPGSQFPPVVDDAIIVTQALGYGYLWVDQFVRHVYA